jgi:hypothetical protein
MTKLTRALNVMQPTEVGDDLMKVAVTFKNQNLFEGVKKRYRAL